MNDQVRMGKFMVECFRMDMKYGDKKVDVLLVPLYKGMHMWVGPGYWEPKIEEKNSEPPSFKYNTKTYTREELIRAGARPTYEYLWMR
jgi:hypothetical protein